MKKVNLCVLSVLIGASCLFSLTAFANGLVVHSEEVGVGKFHRIDNKFHSYAVSAWSPYILASDADISKTSFRKNPDGSFTVFFITLEDLLKTVVQISTAEKQLVSVLNVHGHGLPGGMWFPKDDAELQSWNCHQWRQAAQGSDEDNYKQYYEPVTLDQVQQMRQIAEKTDVAVGCVVGLKEWKEISLRVPEFQKSLSQDLQVHFLSCLVGLGSRGNVFTQGIAELLLNKNYEQGRIESSMNFGLGDWSMTKGMGFWDYKNDQQLENDSNIQVKEKKDILIAQKGNIRMGGISHGILGTAVKENQDIMSTEFQVEQMPNLTPAVPPNPDGIREMDRLTQIRIPGTNISEPVYFQR